MDYNQKLYKFIYNQIKDLKYMYSREYEAIKDTGEINYGLTGYSDDDWKQAWDWATHDVFGEQT